MSDRLQFQCLETKGHVLTHASNRRPSNMFCKHGAQMTKIVPGAYLFKLLGRVEVDDLILEMFGQ